MWETLQVAPEHAGAHEARVRSVSAAAVSVLQLPQQAAQQPQDSRRHAAQLCTAARAVGRRTSCTVTLMCEMYSFIQ